MSREPPKSAFRPTGVETAQANGVQGHDLPICCDNRSFDDRAGDGVSVDSSAIGISPSYYPARQSGGSNSDLVKALRDLLEAGIGDVEPSRPRPVTSSAGFVSDPEDPAGGRCDGLNSTRGETIQPAGQSSGGTEIAAAPPEMSTPQKTSELRRAHWITRRMSGASMHQSARDGSDYESPDASPGAWTHWVGSAMSTASNPADHNGITSFQPRPGEPCSDACSLRPYSPLVDDLPRAATGGRTEFSPLPVCGSAIGDLSPQSSEFHMRSVAFASLERSTDVDGKRAAREAGDMSAELLRPLLRLWLDENMGLLMQKALSAEVGAKQHS